MILENLCIVGEPTYPRSHLDKFSVVMYYQQMLRVASTVPFL